MGSRHDRSWFHRTHLEPFKAWLDKEHIFHRPGKGQWELLQIKHPQYGWMIIHDNSRPEHLTIDIRMHSMIRRFLREYKEKKD